MQAKYIIALVVLVYLILFLVLNNATAEVNFIFFKVYISLAILIIISALMGLILGGVIGYGMKKPKETTGKKTKNGKV